jgi:hypothetical protein
VQDSPIVVRVVDAPRQSGLIDIVLGSLGLAGVILAGAILLGVMVGGVLFWLRSRSA